MRYQPNFIFDEEKMNDFHQLTKKEFLESYSYISEEEYDNTAKTLQSLLKEPCVPDVDVPELVGQMIDIFEDFLDEKGIVIRNPERDEDEDLDPEMSANIYGSDYDLIAGSITDTLKDWGLISSNYNK